MFRLLNMSNLLIDRIQEIIDSGFSQADLYRAAGVTKGTSNQWLDGKIKSIKLEYAQGIQTLTGFNANWIVTGKGSKKINDAQISHLHHPDIQAVIAIMEGTDDRGKAQIKEAALMAAEKREAHIRETQHRQSPTVDKVLNSTGLFSTEQIGLLEKEKK
jgi:hypothetical protein